MKILKAALFLGSVSCVFAQFGGPSILSRGTRSSVLGGTEFVRLRPFIAFNTVYDQGLTAVSVRSDGTVPDAASYGAQAMIGMYGAHRWRKTVFSMDYRGDFRHYSTQSYYDGSNQTLSLGIAHQASKHIFVALREAAGTYGRAFGSPIASGFNDPNPAQNPTSEIFDSRTIYYSSAAEMTYQRSTRLSFNFSGTGFLVRRRSSSLFGTTGANTHGDIAYRYRRHATISAYYGYSYYGFTKGFGNSTIHSVGVDHALTLTRRLEVSVRAGVSRVESKFLELVEVDPVIRAITGQAQTVVIGHHFNNATDVAARLSRGFLHSSLNVTYSRGVAPGNGVYATSQHEGALISYSYSGLRRWNVGLGAGYDTLFGLSQDLGKYRSYQGGGGVTRTLLRSIQWLARIDVRRFRIGGGGIERNLYQITTGFSYSPGDVPLSLW